MFSESTRKRGEKGGGHFSSISFLRGTHTRSVRRSRSCRLSYRSYQLDTIIVFNVFLLHFDGSFLYLNIYESFGNCRYVQFMTFLTCLNYVHSGFDDKGVIQRSMLLYREV